MGTNILIYGESGSGKSHALQFLDPKETFIINVNNQPLPWRGWQKKYTLIDRQNNPQGNYYSSVNHQHVSATIDYVINERPDIKTLIIDDFQYLMSDEFMLRATEKGYDKFSEIAQHVYNLIRKTTFTGRQDLKTIFLSHSQTNDAGKIKLKTIGKMLDEKITLEGMFTIVLYCCIREGQHLFLTKGDGSTIAKSPLGMFENAFINNNLDEVVKAIDTYYDFEDVPAMEPPKKIEKQIKPQEEIK